MLTQDCKVAVDTLAWLDANADGVQDAVEAPLAGATIVVYNRRSAPSDATGRMGMSFLGPCDPTGQLVDVRTVPPPHFTVTTPETVTIELQSTAGGTTPTAAFGFQPIP